ncbi:MAG: pilus assembly protein N-terminal domain-containing protein [Firmicutes bacterium]|nr:pilus assembly protein N-terminal domain-containing protein [Bacillota bacterium]
MGKRVIKGLTVLGLILGLALPVSGGKPIQIPLGHSKLIEVKSFEKLAIGNPEVIQARVMSPGKILVNATGVGKTNILLWEDDRQQELLVEVRKWLPDEVRDFCSQLLEGQVEVKELNGQVYVTGRVNDDPSELERMLVTRFPGLIVRLREVREEFPIGDWESQITVILDNPTIEIKQLGNNVYAVTGVVQDKKELNILETIVGSFPMRLLNLVRIQEQPDLITPDPDPTTGFELIVRRLWPGRLRCWREQDKLVVEGELPLEEYGKYTKVLDSAGPAEIVSLVQESKPEQRQEPQIKVHLHLVEMNLQDLEELGFEWNESLEWTADNSGDGPLQIGSWVRQADLTSRLRALAKHGKLKILAEPELITLAGREAKIHVGGEIPVGSGESGVEWKDYGIQLQITPTVAGENDIHLAIEAEVSSLDWTNAIKTEGGVMPAISSSSFTTVLRQPSGSSTALGGLLERRTGRTKTGVPGLAELPVLGTLFSWDKYEASERELVAIVTPTLVNLEDNSREESVRSDESRSPIAEVSVQGGVGDHSSSGSQVAAPELKGSGR